MLNIIFVILLILIFVICDAFQDTITFHYYTSIFRNLNQQYFNPNISWKNKYKDGDSTLGPKFFGSTTFLVWITDFWHLLKFIKMICICIIISIFTFWWMFLIIMIMWGVLFELIYNGIKE